ncbi:sporulation-delaying protein SdpB family protein [Leifsonia sp. TF02-11]|uniref:sporulation-delaying protein SdpB family protein n=1 Tax=Leifsonia sp. TF02-11 TaxID=2815212 RepID=UPI001AA0E3F1|nr:sporulation-delaying protein SdpB family protein [Leifsonia sp. TF02-11]MBO1739306.1 HTTM domain-containing protein [Leifsonia sp. TF02-11]
MRLNDYVQRFDPQQLGIGVGRSVIAIGQATYLLFTTPQALLVPVIGQQPAPYCDGVKAISLYCVPALSGNPALAHWLMFALLILVASGFLPGPSGMVHAWVSFSLSVSIALPDGGDIAARIVTLLLIPYCLTDRRLWAWRHEAPLGPIRQGIAFATIWAVRLQAAIIYIDSGIAKVASDKWLTGTAEYYVLRDSTFGASGVVRSIGLFFTSSPVIVALATWGAMALEISIGVLIMVGRDRGRSVALVLSILLHVGIIVTIGLWSFGLVMIGLVIIATVRSGTPTRRETDPPPDSPGAVDDDVTELEASSS